MRRQSPRSSSSSPFSTEISIPNHAVGLIIGKGGNTIKTMQQMPGILSLRVSKATSTTSKLAVSGISESVVDEITDKINRLVVHSISTSSRGFYPSFCITCVCHKATASSKLVELKPFPMVDYPDAMQLLHSTTVDCTYYSLFPCHLHKLQEGTIYDPQIKDAVTSRSSSASKVRTTIVSYNGVSSYKDELLDCLAELMLQSSKRKVTLLISLGKQLYRIKKGPSNLGHSTISTENFQHMINARCVEGKFLSFSRKKQVEELDSYLLSLHYEKLGRVCKILVHLVDVETETQYTVSLRPRSEKPEDIELKSKEVKRILQCKDYFEVLSISQQASRNEVMKAFRRVVLLVHPDKNAEPAAVVACRAVTEARDTLMEDTKRAVHLRTLPRNSLICDMDDILTHKPKPRVTRCEKASERHGWVLLVGDSEAAHDLRMGVKSKEDTITNEEKRKVLEWVETAWDDRAEDGTLIFGRSDAGRYRVDAVRYKEAVVYSSENYKTKVTQICSSHRKNVKSSSVYEVCVKSWWVKEALTKWRSHEDNNFLSHVEELVGETRNISRAMASTF